MCFESRWFPYFTSLQGFFPAWIICTILRMTRRACLSWFTSPWLPIFSELVLEHWEGKNWPLCSAAFLPSDHPTTSACRAWGDREHIWSAIKIRTHMPCSNAMLHAYRCLHVFLSWATKEPLQAQPKDPDSRLSVPKVPEDVKRCLVESRCQWKRRGGDEDGSCRCHWCFSSTCSSSTAARESASTAATPSSIRRSCKKLPSLRSKLCIWSNSFRI